jgi:hypothetical protein
MGKTKKCGHCAFMTGEDHYGYGMCVRCREKFGECIHCDDDACEKVLDKDELRHATAVLAQYRRFVRTLKKRTAGISKPPSDRDVCDAIEKVTRYINVLTRY